MLTAEQVETYITLGGKIIERAHDVLLTVHNIRGDKGYEGYIDRVEFENTFATIICIVQGWGGDRDEVRHHTLPAYYFIDDSYITTLKEEYEEKKKAEKEKKDKLDALMKEKQDKEEYESYIKLKQKYEGDKQE